MISQNKGVALQSLRAELTGLQNWCPASCQGGQNRATNIPCKEMQCLPCQGETGRGLWFGHQRPHWVRSSTAKGPPLGRPCLEQQKAPRHPPRSVLQQSQWEFCQRQFPEQREGAASTGPVKFTHQLAASCAVSARTKCRSKHSAASTGASLMMPLLSPGHLPEDTDLADECSAAGAAGLLLIRS